MNKSQKIGTREVATLALADGTIFRGGAIGARGETWGEVVFNTSMTGYQEILTDPSYRRQMITFTYPHIGNVGVNSEDVESSRVQVSGLIIRELSEQFSNFRATKSLDAYLAENGVIGISGIDTREVVLHLRTHGSQMGIIATGKQDAHELVDRARKLPSMEGFNLVDEVTTEKSYEWRQCSWTLGEGYKEFKREELSNRPHIIAFDFGIKYNILRLLIDNGFRVTVVPARTTATEVLALSPDGIFLSNGPGDPAAVLYAIETIKSLVGKKPMFGICLGHQLLGLALGAPTYKLKFGHRGANHPVRDETTGKVEITSQNHGFATDTKRVPSGLKVSHVNLNDQTVEGFSVEDAKAFSIQYHPEASPGPHDARYHFERFKNLFN